MMNWPININDLIKRYHMRKNPNIDYHDKDTVIFLHYRTHVVSIFAFVCMGLAIFLLAYFALRSWYWVLTIFSIYFFLITPFSYRYGYYHIAIKITPDTIIITKGENTKKYLLNELVSIKGDKERMILEKKCTSVDKRTTAYNVEWEHK